MLHEAPEKLHGGQRHGAPLPFFEQDQIEYPTTGSAGPSKICGIYGPDQQRVLRGRAIGAVRNERLARAILKKTVCNGLCLTFHDAPGFARRPGTVRIAGSPRTGRDGVAGRAADQ